MRRARQSMIMRAGSTRKHDRVKSILPEALATSSLSSTASSNAQLVPAVDIMRSELRFVSNNTNQLKQEFSSIPDERAGVEILQLFIQDLL